MTVINNLSLEFNVEKSTYSNFTEISEESFAVDYRNCEDSRIIILINSVGSDGSITVRGGDSIQGGDDLEMFIVSEESYAVVLESGKYMQTSGEYAGYVIFDCNGSYEIAVIELP